MSTKLSNSYTVEQTFNIEWINIPEGVIIPDNNQKLNTSITASGIEIILYRLFDDILKIDLNQADFGREIFELNVENQKFFISNNFITTHHLIKLIHPLLKLSLVA